jgi:hypothetical protein
MKSQIVALRVISYLCLGAALYGLFVYMPPFIRGWVGLGLCIFLVALGGSVLAYTNKLKSKLAPQPHVSTNDWTRFLPLANVRIQDWIGFLGDIRGSLIGAGVMFALDGVLSGSFIVSIFVCPIWFLVAVFKAIARWKDWPVAGVRVITPVITLALVLGNSWLQSQVAQAHAQKIIEASAQYEATNGVYPETLDKLVPKYLDSVPRAKYALSGEFFYWVCPDEFPLACTRIGAKDGQHMLMWIKVPPFGRPVYNLEQARWGYLD